MICNVDLTFHLQFFVNEYFNYFLNIFQERIISTRSMDGPRTPPIS